MNSALQGGCGLQAFYPFRSADGNSLKQRTDK